MSSRTPTRWIVDSGASVHIVSSPLLLDRIDLQIAPIHISTMTGAIAQSAAASPCTIRVIDPVTGVTSYITLTCAYFVPDAAFNLLSVQRLLDQGVDTIFDKRHPLFHGALTDSGQGTIICRIQNVGASLIITCPAAPLPDFLTTLRPALTSPLQIDSIFALHPRTSLLLRLKMCLYYCSIGIYPRPLLRHTLI